MFAPPHSTLCFIKQGACSCFENSTIIIDQSAARAHFIVLFNEFSGMGDVFFFLNEKCVWSSYHTLPFDGNDLIFKRVFTNLLKTWLLKVVPQNRILDVGEAYKSWCERQCYYDLLLENSSIELAPLMHFSTCCTCTLVNTIYSYLLIIWKLLKTTLG